MSLEFTLTLIGAGLVMGALLSYRILWRGTRHAKYEPKLNNPPSVTVIRPVRGLDTGARENIRAALDNGYPGKVETLFVLDDETEPAVPLIREEIRRHTEEGGHGTARVIFCGPPPAFRTGKLNAMIVGLRAARNKLIAFADSDIRPDKKSLTTLVATLVNSPRAGSASAPVYSALPARTVGDSAYTMLMNGLYGPTAAALTHLNGGELPFIMGQFMIFRRDAIDAIGGLESADGQLVDDMYLGAQVKQAGYRNMISPRRVPIIQEGLSFKEFLEIYHKWLTFSRSGLPQWSFKALAWMPGLVFWLGLIGSVAALVNGYWVAAGLSFLAPVVVAGSANLLNGSIGGASMGWRYGWVSFALLVFTPAVLLNTYRKRNVVWRGRTYDLNAKSTLAKQSGATKQGRAEA
jgi:ceramide glucosyltransferase